jgi:hypothetical protein
LNKKLRAPVRRPLREGIRSRIAPIGLFELQSSAIQLPLFILISINDKIQMVSVGPIVLQKSQKMQRAIFRQRTKQATSADQ